MRKLLIILGLLVFIGPIVAGVYLINENQDVRSRADSNNLNPIQNSSVKPNIFESGFETGAFQCSSCNPDGWHDATYEEDSAQFVTSPSIIPREGRYALRIHIDKDDDFGSDSPRAEISATYKKGFFETKKEYWVGWSIYIPNDTEFDTLQPEILTQYKKSFDDGCDTIGNPPNSLQLLNGRWRWSTITNSEDCVTDTNTHRTITDIGEAKKGKWTDFIARFYFSPENDGILQVWIDGKIVLDKVNQPNYYQSTQGPYMKIGIYKPNWLKKPSSVTTQTVYYDSIRVYEGTNGQAAVTPKETEITPEFCHSQLLLSPKEHIGKIPDVIGDIQLIQQADLVPYQNGFLTGNWLLFHRGSSLTLSGKGYFVIRWEVEYWQNFGTIKPPLFTLQKGVFQYLGEEPFEYIDKISGWQNKYYYLDGTVNILNTENTAESGQTGLYNLAVSPVSKDRITVCAKRVSQNAWIGTDYHGEIPQVTSGFVIENVKGLNNIKKGTAFTIEATIRELPDQSSGTPEEGFALGIKAIPIIGHDGPPKQQAVQVNGVYQQAAGTWKAEVNLPVGNYNVLGLEITAQCQKEKPCTRANQINSVVWKTDVAVVEQSTPSPTSLPPSVCIFPPIEQSTLAEYAQKRDFNIGALASECELNAYGKSDQTKCENILKREYSGMTVPFQIAWRTENPRGKIDYTLMDRVINFAKANNLRLHFYHLIWDQKADWPPNWLFGGNNSCGNWTKTDLEQVMKERIQKTIAHAGDVVTTWNVVNEAFTNEGKLRQECFYKIVGPDYIDKAFQFAREAAPNAVLVLNETFGRQGGVNRKMVDGFFSYVKQAKTHGVPIDAVGLQNHLRTNLLDGTYLPNLQYFMDKAKDAGVKVFITEMDVYQGPAGFSPSPQEKIKDIYKQTLAVCLKNSNCVSFYTWGISDVYTWLRMRDLPDAKPLLFDENYQRKPAYNGIMEALRENTTRVCVPEEITPTPMLTRAPTATPTSSPRLTVTPTLTPTVILNPTATGIVVGNVKLNLKLKFQGITKLPATGENSMTIKVKVQKQGELTTTDGAGTFVADANGLWTATVGVNLSSLSGKYKILIKGPQHIQKKICDAVPTEASFGTYKCSDGNINLIVGDNNLNFSGILLLSGDLDQSSVVDSIDFSLIKNNLGKTDVTTLAKADINHDGRVDSQDYSLIISALSIRTDEL